MQKHHHWKLKTQCKKKGANCGRIPFILAFDGIVSILRTYSTEELVTLANRAGTEHFRWEVRQSKELGWGQMTCLIGWPSKEGGVHVVQYDASVHNPETLKQSGVL